LVFSPFYVQAIKYVNGAFQPVFSELYLFFAVYFILYLALGIIILIRKYFLAEKKEKNQVQYVLWGMFLAFFLAIITDLILPAFGETRLFMLGPYFTLIMVGFTSYAITKHRLMDISVVISRAVAELLTISFNALAYGAIVMLYRNYVSTAIDPLFFMITLLCGIFVGQTHHNMRIFIQTSSDKLFLRGKYDYYQAISSVSAQITKKLSMENITSTLKKTFSEVMEVSNPRLYLADDFEKPEVKEYLNYKEISYHENDLIIPCLLEEQPIAFIVLGKKLSEDDFTEEDIKLLKALASQTAVVIDHTRTYEIIKKELEVTQTQLERSQRLASLGTLTAGVTHEIRNPLTVVRARMETLFDQPRDQEYLKMVQRLVLENIDRVEAIVQRMLKLAKNKGTKEYVAVNLNDIIEKSLIFFPAGRIVINKEYGGVPPVKGDPEEIQEVFVNLIQNGLEAMKGQDSGILSIKTGQQEGQAIVEISDTGKGIPEDIKEKIFDPFFSTRHEGTGLGLSIVYRIVREHGGEVSVHSDGVEKGSTFKVVLPAVI